MDKDVSNIEFDPQSLVSALNEKRLTQAELNRRAGYPHRNTVNKIIKASREATATDLLRFCVILDKSPLDFAKQ